MIRPTLLFALFCACIGCAATPPPSPSLIAPALPSVGPGGPGPAPMALSAEAIQRAEALRAEGMELLYSKDPMVRNPAKAVEKFTEAGNLGDPISMDQLGGIYATGLPGVIKEDCPKAIDWFEKSASGGYPLALNNLAYTLLTCADKSLRDKDKAESLLTLLFQNSPGMLAILDTYSALLAAQGNFPQAAKTLSVVIDLAELTGGNPEQIDEMKATLKLYRRGKNREK